jgi:hypothetical protein
VPDPGPKKIILDKDFGITKITPDPGFKSAKLLVMMDICKVEIIESLQESRMVLARILAPAISAMLNTEGGKIFIGNQLTKILLSPH